MDSYPTTIKKPSMKFSPFVAAILILLSLNECHGQAPAVQDGDANAKSGSDATSRRPNVIVILADDLAVGDLAGGDGSPTRTPNLDRFASESIQFSQAYSGSCVCAPARAALLTGRYPHRTGVVTLNMNKYPEMTRLRRDETMIADVLKDAGYATGLVGKWHTGRGDGFHPLDRGFDVFEGFFGSDDVGYFRYPFSEQRQISDVDESYLTDDLNRRAIEFVRRHHEHPFFLHLAHYAPHRPLEAPSEVIARYRDQGFDESTATIYAMIEVMDRGIGELLSEIDDLGLSEDTIVLFASDNGPDPLTGERFNRELRGTKYQVNEGGIRVPLFVRWSKRLAPGQRDQMVTFVDLMPTILDLCRVDVSMLNRLDGESFVPVLKNASIAHSTMRFWQWNRASPNYTHNAAVRHRRYKLVRPYVTRGAKLKDSTEPSVLFDLQNDPTESRDVSKQYPDIAERMSRELDRWSASVETDRLRPVKIPRDVQ
ncbi:arylsulfatase A [Rhodopirellula baltica WH47]|uniref:Arylsulfatase A n=2 Tax=Rhodopirellula baltica TaxID=265606 RepID=F2AQ31_RHOBT|nr:arylsulfatase A [Rhodopirellula baltica WH47]